MDPPVTVNVIKHRTINWVHILLDILYITVLMQERCNSIANTLELHLSCINPSICQCMWTLYDIVHCQWNGSGCAVTWALLFFDQKARHGVDLLQRLHWWDSLLVTWWSNIGLPNLDMTARVASVMSKDTRMIVPFEGLVRSSISMHDVVCMKILQ